jgi:hypothetical protein
VRGWRFSLDFAITSVFIKRISEEGKRRRKKIKHIRLKNFPLSLTPKVVLR